MSLEVDFVDKSARNLNTQCISGRGIRFSNWFPKISITLPDDAGQPYFRHTVAGAYRKILENFVSEGSSDGQTEFDIQSKKFPKLCQIIPEQPSFTQTMAEVHLVCVFGVLQGGELESKI
ncbi:hypothetical protein TNCV_228321 [Trichonephila clavipes]|nr:hypothetical protein TNCV_228321 [Trichonephila clavipes]